MQVLIGEIRPFPNARADEEQAAKILEEAAEVFAAWQVYDECLKEKENGNLLNAWAAELYRDDFLNECADLIMACANMLHGSGQRIRESYHAATSFQACEKTYLRTILMQAALVFRVVDDAENVPLEAQYVIVKTCNVIASLGITDFRPYMQECEQRNRERGRYEHQAN